jgi:hypothetical protein
MTGVIAVGMTGVTPGDEAGGGIVQVGKVGLGAPGIGPLPAQVKIKVALVLFS